MRPEYLAAVEAARTGWLYWASILVPSTILWIRVLGFPRRRILATVAFLAAWASAYSLGLCQGDHVESTKHAHMQTSEERQDWANDAWRAFAPVVGIPGAFVACAVQTLVALGVRGLWERSRGISRSFEPARRA